jgi:glutathione synthase/RimK-type ligase-like ATP-grasp enzyme
MTDFTFVTYSGMPELDADDRLAVDVLAQRGYEVATAVWDDPAVHWSGAGTVIIRSTWDYNLKHEAFLAWAQSVTRVAPLYNPLELVRWNIHKSYLSDLASKGVSVVPTLWLAAKSQAELRTVLAAAGWPEAVIKPGIGLSTYGVRRVSGTAQDQAHLDGLLVEHDVMVQPFIKSVQDYGERSLMFINGTYSHAARKTAFQPLLPTGEAGETPAEATGAEIAVAAKAMQALPTAALYARVDLVHGAAGEPLVIECELIEPTLFLSMHPRAAHRFADALESLTDVKVRNYKEATG